MAIFKKFLLIFFAVILVLSVNVVMFFFVSFKTSYKEIVISASKTYNIEPSLIFSIIKAESKFNKNAKSIAGAIGLMQIKLETANYMLELNGEDAITETELFLPKNNIKLGTKYFAYILNKFEDVDVSICAYNAGETIVRQWLQDETFSLDHKTLNKIPYAETENYLKKVKFNQKIYKNMLKI